MLKRRRSSPHMGRRANDIRVEGHDLTLPQSTERLENEVRATVSGPGVLH